MKPRTNHLAFRRSGFTLMELMVAVAILLAVLALIGTIFATVSKAGGNATSMATLHRQLSQVAEIIERDLQYTSPGPGGAPIGIAGRIIPAHETQRDRDLRNAPTPHRADTLMLFTTAAQDPIYPISTDLAALSQVVYGHADFGKFNVATGKIDRTTIRQLEDTSIPIDQRQPASQWHLARRVIRFLAAGPPTESPPLGSGRPVRFGHLTDPQFLTGEAEVYWGSISEVKAMFPELFPEGGLLLQLADKKLGGTQDGFPAPNWLDGYLLYNGNLFGRGNDGRWWVLGETGWSRQQYDPNTGKRVLVTSDTSDGPEVGTIVDLESFENLCRDVFYDCTAP
ncbi:MAG TPA: prepilin-type N-terminal cleavage/methylation domain-containing protein, partial [Phycisphaerae bacterium]|nr:prepilin-type N-terminal cleavage/methylation domain-containing protein [Phycisphaerae bacterium]